MSKVTDTLAQDEAPVFVSDFTPPRGADVTLLDGAAQLEKSHFVSVAYNPGKLVRLDSITAAYHIRRRFTQDVVFNFSPRDMNRIAIESRLLGASSLGLENVLVIQGDSIAERDGATEVMDYRATELIGSIRRLNEGLDYKGSKLRSSCDFCIGASIDPTRPIEHEVSLVKRKLEAGAQFFVSQPVFGPQQVNAIHTTYRSLAGRDLSAPVFWGVQLLSKDGVLFSSIPEETRNQVEAGRDGVEIALEVFEALRSAGERAFYVVAPILRGGARDYASAARFLSEVAS